MTPIYYQIHNLLDREYKALDRDKITHWLMRFKMGVDIDDCRGGRITLGGNIEFEGQPREIYWSFITPCLQDIVHDVLRQAEDQGRRYPPEVAREALDEAADLLKSFITKVYDRMVNIDRTMRGKGYPENVEPYDPSQKVSALHANIDEQVAAFKGQIALPTWLQQLSAKLEQHRILVTIVISLVFGGLAGALGSGIFVSLRTVFP